jgi:hypothetical protein
MGENDEVDVAGREAELLEPGVEVLVLGHVVVGEEFPQPGRTPSVFPVSGAAGVPEQLAFGRVNKYAVTWHIGPLRRLELVLTAAHGASGRQQ